MGFNAMASSRRSKSAWLYFYPYYLPAKKCPRCRSHHLHPIYNHGQLFCFQCRYCGFWWRPSVIIDGKLIAATIEHVERPINPYPID